MDAAQALAIVRSLANGVDPELAAAHERTMGAVRARLLKYGRINA